MAIFASAAVLDRYHSLSYHDPGDYRDRRSNTGKTYAAAQVALVVMGYEGSEVEILTCFSLVYILHIF